MEKYQKELFRIAQFLKNTTGITVSIPCVKLSNRIRDIEIYRHPSGRSEPCILINLKYLERYQHKIGQKISVKALLAHSFFHHVQYVLKIDYTQIAKVFLIKSIGKSALKKNYLLKEASNNLIESSAMFFALAYLIKGKNRKARILKMLVQEAYMPPPGKHIKGNGLLMAYLKAHSINQTLKAVLSVDNY